MTKYVHVDGDNGMVEVLDAISPDPDYFGWIYEVPDGFEIGLTLDKMHDVTYIYELFENHPSMKKVKQS